MKLGFAAAAACVMACAGSSAAAQAPAGEHLDIPPYPAAAPWQKVTDKQNGEQLYVEWIPADQKVEAIRDIVTQQAFYRLKGSDPGPSWTGS
jgi:hypothetical protein